MALSTEEQAAKSALLSLDVGREVVVVKGRKVPRGTTGIVFWMGPGDYGPRVGFKDPKGNTHWTAAANVEVTIPGLAPGQFPPGGWAAFLEAQSSAQKAWEQSFPRKGEQVRVVKSPSNPVRGRVFWCQDTRIGVKRNGAPEEEEPIWCNVWEVEVLDDIGSVRKIEPRPPPLASQPRATPTGPEPLIKTAPNSNGFIDLDLDDDDELDPIAAALQEMGEKKPDLMDEFDKLNHPPDTTPLLATYPAPFNRIAEIRSEKGFQNAYDSEGVFIIRLTDKSAQTISALLLE